MSKIKINVNESVTKRLPFKPDPEYDNMCVGTLIGVEVTESEIAADKNWEYAGKVVPRLVFTFKQNKKDKSDSDRFHSHSEMLVANTKADGTDRKEADIINSYKEAWSHVKHIHDAFATHPNYKPITSAPEFDPDLAIDAKILMFRAFYDGIVKAFNNGNDGETPIYDKTFNVTVKLLASGRNDAYLGFPSFTNKGFIEKTRILNGVFKTDLAFYGTETYKLGGAGQAVVASEGDPGMTNGQGLSEAAKKALNIG